MGLTIGNGLKVGKRRQGALLRYSQRFNYAYGVLIDETQANSDLQRVGNSEFAQQALVNAKAVQGTMTVDDSGVGILKKMNPTNGLLYADGSASVVDGSAGNVMSYMPPFYYNVELLDSTHYRLWVSTYRIQGFKLHPGWCLGSFKAAVNNTAVYGKPVNSLWSVANESTTFRGGNDDATNDSLQKGFLGKPRTLISRTNFWNYAQNQGSDFGIIDYTTHIGLMMLFATKYATLNSQKAVSAKVDGYYAGGLGNGLTTVNSTDWSNYNGYYPLAKCGLTLGHGLVDEETDLALTNFNVGGDLTVKVNSFMGIENLFGDIWEWTQGINVWKQTVEEGDKFLAYIYDKNAYEDTITNKYSRFFEFAKTEGWLKTIIGGEFFDMLIKEVNNGASSSTYFTDYFYNNITTGLRGLLRGGSASGSYAGLGCASASLAASSASTSIGSRLRFSGRVRPGV